MFCPTSSINNELEPQEDNINAGYRYATSKGRPFIVDNIYYVDSKKFEGNSAYPPLSTHAAGSTNYAIRVLSKSVLAFQNGGELKLKPTEKQFGTILHIFDIENYIILDPVTVGDKETHLATEGEQMHCIHLGASKNGYIRNPICRDSWGDGIYLGFTFWVKPTIDVFVPTDVIIDNPKFYNIGRNAISLCGAHNVTFNNVYVEKVSRTLPLAGVDIEPEEDINYTDKMFIRDVVFNNSTFINCGYAISTNVFGNREVKVAFSGTTKVINKGADGSWFPCFFGSQLGDEPVATYKQDGYVNISHLIVDDTDADLAFKFLVEASSPKGSIKHTIDKYEFISNNVEPQISLYGSSAYTQAEGVSINDIVFHNKPSFIQFVNATPTMPLPSTNYKLNIPASIPVSNPTGIGLTFHGDCYIGGHLVVWAYYLEDKNYPNNLILIPKTNPDLGGALTARYILNNVGRKVNLNLNPALSSAQIGSGLQVSAGTF